MEASDRFGCLHFFNNFKNKFMVFDYNITLSASFKQNSIYMYINLKPFL